MKYEIKFSVQLCMIDEKRKEHAEIKARLFQLERGMAQMVLDRQVGLYAVKLARYEYLKELLATLPANDLDKAKKEKSDLESELFQARRNYSFVRYHALRSEYNELKKHLSDYYTAVNTDFRNELKDKNLPNIYVFQGNDKPGRHIIIPDRVTECMEIGGNTIIYPYYELYSNREYRHFYNKTSFKYLEQLSQDCMYAVDNKNLGKIKIKKK